jgi:hypothetical protein
MALDRFEVRVSIQKVLLGLVLVIVPLSIVGLYLTAKSDTALDASIGTHLKTIAQMYGNNVSHLFNERISGVKLISADPGIVEAVAAANRGYQNQSESAVSEKIDKADKAWSTPQSAPAVKALLTSKVSETLRHYHDMEPQIMRILITDEHGVPVASTVKPSQYSQAKSQGWHSVYAGGKGAVTVGSILYDETSKSYYIDVGVPVTEAGTGQVAGVTLASVNITPLLATFQEDSLGNGLKAFLVNDDGTVISGPKTDVFARVRSDEFAAIGDALGSVEGRQTSYVTAELPKGRYIIGFADTGMQKISKNLNWTVLVSQDERQATAPIRVLGQFATLMVVLALFMVTLLAVYYALHRKQQFADIEGVLPVPKPLTPPHPV